MGMGMHVYDACMYWAWACCCTAMLPCCHAAVHPSGLCHDRSKALSHDLTPKPNPNSYRYCYNCYKTQLYRTVAYAMCRHGIYPPYISHSGIRDSNYEVGIGLDPTETDLHGKLSNRNPNPNPKLVRRYRHFGHKTTVRSSNLTPTFVTRTDYLIIALLTLTLLPSETQILLLSLFLSPPLLLT